MKLIVDEGGAKYIPVAKSRLKAIEDLRNRINVPTLQRTYVLADGAFIRVRAWAPDLRASNLIQIIVPAAGQILLSRIESGRIVVYVYDYLKKTLRKIGAVSGDAEHHLSIGVGTESLLLEGATTASALTQIDGSKALAGAPTFEDLSGEVATTVISASRIDRNTGRAYLVSIAGGAATLYAKTAGQAYRKCATFPATSGYKWVLEDGDHPHAFQVAGGYVYLTRYETTEPTWNLFNGYQFVGYNPDTQISTTGSWNSDIWFDDTGGFGGVGITYAGLYGLFSTAEAVFGTIIDDRVGGKTGYMDLLVSGVWEDPEQGAAWEMQGWVYFGRFGGGKQAYDSNPYRIDYSDSFTTTDDVRFHYWSFSGADDSAEYWAVLAYVDSGAYVLHRSSGGAPSEVLLGAGYVHHGVSSDGSLVIIEGANGGTVVDLKAVVVTQHSLVSGFASSCFISDAQKVVPEVDADVTIGYPPPTMQSLGAVRPGDSSTGPTGDGTNWKLRTKDGPFRVIGFMFSDPCWGWAATAVFSESGVGTVIIDETSYQLSEAPYIVGASHDGDVLFGAWEEYQRVVPVGGGFEQRSDGLDDIRTIPIEVTAGEGIDRVMVFAHSSLAIYSTPLGYPDGTLQVVGGAKSPIVWAGARLVDPMDQETVATGIYALLVSSCDEDVTVTATDACGRVATTEVSLTLEALELSGTDEPQVGDVYTASGGSAPYSYGFTGGSIDAETGEILSVTSCGGPDGNGGVAAVTVSDDCGGSASITVRLPGGSWSTVVTECEFDPCEGCSGYYDHTYQHVIVTGATKTTNYYCAVSLASPYGYPCTNISWPCCTYCTLGSLDPYFTFTTVFKRCHLFKVGTQSWEC